MESQKFQWSDSKDFAAWGPSGPQLIIHVTKDKVTGQYSWECNFDKAFRVPKEDIVKSNLGTTLAEIGQLIPEFIELREEDN